MILGERPPARVLAGLAGLALLAAVGTGWFAWRSRPRAVPVAAPVVSASASGGGFVVVDVAGSVRRPGVLRLPLGSRVVDALRAAGGVLPGAVTTGLNLARRLEDGEQVLVGVAGAPGGAAAPGRLDLNAATLEQLDALPGIGPVLAQHIVEWRTSHGRFTSVDQLREVPGIGPRTFESLKDLVVA